MSKSKAANLQSILDGKKAAAAAATPETPSPVVTENGEGKTNPRGNLVNISAWLSKDFKTSIRLVQARKLENSSLQYLLGEALNDLFSKYNVPTVTLE